MATSAWLLIISMLALGKICRQSGLFDGDNAALILNRYVIYIALPPLIVHTLQNLSLSIELIYLAVLPWILAGLSLGLVLLSNYLRKWSRETLGTLILLCTLGNTAFLGYPAIGALLGEQALPHAVIYDQFGSFILLSSFGLFVAAYFDTKQVANTSTMIKNILQFPPFIALVVGLLPIPWPDSTLEAMHSVGASLVPVACFAVGLQWRLRLAPESRFAFAVGLSIKMLIMPLAALGIMKLLNLSSEMSAVAVLQSGMPPMITAGAIAASAGLNKDLAAAMVGFGVVFAVASLPILSLLPF